jgi:uncharacterized protein with von Willebrand factor type A (vWA) domain
MSETDHELLIRIDERIGQIKRTLERREEICQQVVEKFTTRISRLEVNNRGAQRQTEQDTREDKSEQASSLNQTSLIIALIVAASGIIVSLIALFK